MTRSIELSLAGKFFLVLFCAMLGACASTQKSNSTGSGEQSAAPISDAGKPSTSTQSSDAKAPASGANASSPSAGNAGKPGDAGAAGAQGGKAAAEGAAGANANEEAAQLKKQLEDQEAQINRLRNDQQADAVRDETEAAKQRQQDAAAAAGQPSSQANAAGAPGKSAASEDAAVFPPGAGSQQQESGADAGAAAAAPTMERSVYFAYDQSSVPEKYDDMLLANAAYLKAHPALKAEVQGNCDERGSREYNLALGARRAEAVKRALELAGADGSRISAISYGAEKPIALGKDEESYSKNRRADIVY